ncbi:23S rRNA pseudouridine1911/1915/1917 synthase [Peptostreptococcaceae bacterium pGA-8]|nr:23S rRNA pseudouridine1911/1915/1917 synthase [Peptostreptococcaceae bacterium pGA-8]
MSEIKIIIDEEVCGLRLDKAIAYKAPELSRGAVQKAFEAGDIMLNGRVLANKDRKLLAENGQEVLINPVDSRKSGILPQKMDLDIYYEDDDIMVINKPRGMVVHPGVGNYSDTLVNGLLYHCGDALSKQNGDDRPGIVHRIDKATSGLLLVAKTDKAYVSLVKQLKEHSVTREYLALVHNNLIVDEGIIDEPLGRHGKNRLKRWVDYENGKKAVTHYEVIERFGKYTLVKCVLETGRTHQIRVHMAYIKHPLVGDETYGIKNDKLFTGGQLLHAMKLGFIHPGSGEYMEFTSPLPDVFENTLAKLRGKI